MASRTQRGGSQPEPHKGLGMEARAGHSLTQLEVDTCWTSPCGLGFLTTRVSRKGQSWGVPVPRHWNRATSRVPSVGTGIRLSAFSRLA